MFYPVLFFIAKSLDYFSTVLLINKVGLENELNPLGKFLLTNLNVYQQFGLFLFFTWMIYLVEKHLNKYKVALGFVRAMIWVTLLVSLWNFTLYFFVY